MITENQPVLYFLENGPTRSFVKELQVVPNDTELPPKICNVYGGIL